MVFLFLFTGIYFNFVLEFRLFRLSFSAIKTFALVVVAEEKAKILDFLSGSCG